MSVFVSDFNPGDGTWTVMHDDAIGGAHTGSVQPTDVQRATNMDGTESHQHALLTCPVCGDTSSHPVGGGANAPLVQELFIHLALRDQNCPCQPATLRIRGLATKDATQAAHDHVKEHCEEMDFEGRWQVTQQQLEDSGLA